MASQKRSDGEGSLYPRHSPECERPMNAKGDPACKCPWHGALVIGWQDGKPVRKKVTAASKAGAAAKLRDLRDKAAVGQLPHGRVPTVGEWMSYWLEQIAAKKNRPSTIKTYSTYVNHYINPLLGSVRLDRLTPEHITAAWDVLRSTGRPTTDESTPLSETSIHQAHVVLSRALKVAMQRGKVTRNAATLMDAPKLDHQDAEILTVDQAKAVISAARAGRNAARWTVAFSLGLRQGEALGLRWADVDLDNGILVVRHSLGRVKGKGLVQGPTKSGRSRPIALPGPLLSELKAHRLVQNTERLAARTWWRDLDYVFAREDGRPYDAKDDWKRWKQLLAVAGAPDVKLHSARHSAATMLLAMGVPLEVVGEILGHTDLKITRGYQHRVDDLHVAAAEKMATAYWD